ncbi:MAG: hypothetical protein JNL05_08985 [Flavobacteriales bacterium]|nr:hypothetical protein [Flavobacteriales bacterium]
MMRYLITTSILSVITLGLHAQVFSNKPVGRKNEALVDSLKKAEYPYALPIWGEKAAALGFDLPYSAGIGTQYISSVAPLTIDNLMVGFNNGEMRNLDGLVRFDRSEATAQGLSVRPDVWLFPFLNVYGILGKNQGSTDVGWGLWLPDSSGVDQLIFRSDSKVDFNATTFGLGLTPTIGVAGAWLALDMNFTWSDVPQLEDPAFAFVFGPRLGKRIQLKDPESNLNFWVGGFRLKLSSETVGSVPLADVVPADEWGANIDAGYQRVEEIDQQVDAWWAGLSPLEQANPLNEARYNAANALIDRASGFLEAADRAANDIANSSVQYSIQKRQKDMWNFIIGGQYQLNKHWMIRAEYGFLAARTQFLTGLQYRFGL